MKSMITSLLKLITRPGDSTCGGVNAQCSGGCSSKDGTNSKSKKTDKKKDKEKALDIYPMW